MLPVSGFSKMSRKEKIDYLNESYLGKSDLMHSFMESFFHKEPSTQEIFDNFSENTITNFFMPYGVVPNMLINGKLNCVPMVTEESSVVAACSKSAKFWMSRGGFQASVISVEKVGHVHFLWKGESEKLFSFFEKIKRDFFEGIVGFVSNMQKRGGGILSIELLDKTSEMENLYQIKGVFDTCDAMGANFINTILEEWANILKQNIKKNELFDCDSRDVDIIMAILSNYTPECLVRASVKCPVKDLDDNKGNISGHEFAHKFINAVNIARLDPYRATTHNKGIFNGIDAVVMATGNDSRAIEACGHAYASRSGQYRSLSNAKIEGDDFIFTLEIPLAVGTVGGLTSLHPLSKISLKLLGNPNAKQLMKVIACAGLAQNFAALRSLVTTGIQKGHMKMHLMNIINQLEASNEEKALIIEEFEEKTISFNSVSDFLTSIRKIQ